MIFVKINSFRESKQKAFLRYSHFTLTPQTAASGTFAFSRKENVCIIWINLATLINQGKAFCNASSVWSSLVKSYHLVGLIIYYNDSDG